MTNTYYPPQGENQQKPDQPQPPQGYYPPTGYNYSQPPYDRPPYGYGSYGYYPQVEVKASLGARFLALIIDSIIISIPSGILYAILGAIFRPFSWDGNGPQAHYPFGLTASVVFWGLYAWFCYVSLNGNTLGKSVMNIKLVTSEGLKPSLQQFVLHFSIGYWINGLVLCLGYIWAIFDPENQTWGQKVFRDKTVRGRW